MLSFIPQKAECPNCYKSLDTKPIRNQDCPHCGKPILIRNGELLTEEDSKIEDWLLRLEGLGVTRNDFDNNRDQLSKKFGKQASINDTIWSILNQLIMKYGKNLNMLEQIYREMASMVSSEGRDPTQYLMEAEKVRNRRLPESKSEKEVFLGHDELAYIRGLRKEGKLEKAEELLYKAEPSPAVLDEIRKIASDRARSAKKIGDWQSVVKHLESYSDYASKWRDYCVKMVNQEPPLHTANDIKLLQEAKQKLGE